MNCYSEIFQASLLTSGQLAALTVINLILMVANIFANGLVIYILIKTKQILQTACKLIFVLSASDLLLGLFCQNLLFAMFYTTKCSIIEAYLFLVTLLLHLSCYSLAIIGVDRYLRIKHYRNFRTMWTRRVVLKLFFVAVFLALLQAVLVLAGSVLGKQHIVTPFYIAVDGVVIGLITFLQVQTIRTSNAVHNESTAVASDIINKKITKLSMRIMLLLCVFITPHLIVYTLRENIRKRLDIYEKGITEFVSFLTIILTYANSFANAVLFLMTNVKGKRFLQNFGQ